MAEKNTGKMRIGITGAHGFIGSHLYKRLKEIEECEPFDRQKYSLFDIESMKPFVQGKDVILHLAGANCASNEELLKVNTLGTLNLLEAIRKYSPETRIVFTSSLQVYGPTMKLRYLAEFDPLTPDSLYGLSKKFAEEIVNKYSELYGIRGLIFRISNVYGEGCRPYYNSAIATFIDLIFKGEKIIVNGTGEQARDFIYVSDVVEAFLKALRYNLKQVDTLNICTGKPISINEVISSLEEVTGTIPNIECNETGEQLSFLIGNPSKAARVLEYRTKVDLKDGLSAIIKFQKGVKQLI